jgi:hypothetical protein
VCYITYNFTYFIPKGSKKDLRKKERKNTCFSNRYAYIFAIANKVVTGFIGFEKP